MNNPNPRAKNTMLAQVCNMQLILILFSLFMVLNTCAKELKDGKDHPIISRYPGQELKWHTTENYQAYKVPTGMAIGYRIIENTIETQGQVTRIFYTYNGTDKTHREIWVNYLDALKQADFKILGAGAPTLRSENNLVGSRKWLGYALHMNPLNSKNADVARLLQGSSSQGGSAAIVATKQRAAGVVYVVIYLEQDTQERIGTLIDIIEVGAAETGLVAVDAEAIGEDISEYGRVVLDGILFEFDKARLKPESKQALDAIAAYIKAHPKLQFYVVGHTDSKGSYAYNKKLSADRAYAVVNALTTVYKISSARIVPYGVGPLVPIFSNNTDDGRNKNRRVELVEM
jgi:outer membrane protein OmpA-like peptidoglycan-associated protein